MSGYRSFAQAASVLSTHDKALKFSCYWLIWIIIRFPINVVQIFSHIAANCLGVASSLKIHQIWHRIHMKAARKMFSASAETPWLALKKSITWEKIFFAIFNLFTHFFSSDNLTCVDTTWAKLCRGWMKVSGEKKRFFPFFTAEKKMTERERCARAIVLNFNK